MWFLCWTVLAHATAPVVAMGDGLVVAPPQTAARVPASLGWVPVLADCLNERKPGSFQMIDRVAPGETAQSARGRVTSVLELSPSVVILGVGARELGAQEPDVGAFNQGLEALLDDLVAPATPSVDVVLLGVVPPRDAGPDSPATKAVEDWNVGMGRLAEARPSVHFVDLWAKWPKLGEGRTSLLTSPHELSPAGHARVAAHVCEVLVNLHPATQKQPPEAAATAPE